MQKLQKSSQSDVAFQESFNINGRHMKAFGSLRISFALLTLTATFSGPAGAQSPPLNLARTGYFYVGGKIDDAAANKPYVGHMYAEFMIPRRVRHPYPIVMVHGGSQTGTNFTGNIEGKEGWAQYFARRGYAVYIVDQVAAGRSPYWSQVYGPLPPPGMDFFQSRFVAPEQFKLWPQAKLHTQFPGTGKQGDPYFDALYAAQFPSITSFTKQQEVNPEALAALLDKIGPAIVLTHSRSGAFGWPLVDRRPKLVKALVSVEPSGPPVHDIVNLGAPDWYKDAEPTKISGLGDVPLVYDPPLVAGQSLDVERQAAPDGPDMVRCWKQKEPARKLTNLKGIPVVIVASEASYHAPYDHCTSAWLTQAGVPNTFIRLADRGVHGNGHMMMIEKNSDAIAAVIESWVAKTFPGERSRR
jgi:pimeloyl-ACP methyl ester carboxylesterase